MTTRILVTGSRTWTDYPRMLAALREWKAPGAVLVHGAARGADYMAASIWRAWGLPVETHSVHWQQCADQCPPGHRRTRHDGTEYCPTAGHRRNNEMVAAGATVCLAFIRDGSRGATHCANAAQAAGIPTRSYLIAASDDADKAQPSEPAHPLRRPRQPAQSAESAESAHSAEPAQADQPSLLECDEPRSPASTHPAADADKRGPEDAAASTAGATSGDPPAGKDQEAAVSREAASAGKEPAATDAETGANSSRSESDATNWAVVGRQRLRDAQSWVDLIEEGIAEGRSGWTNLRDVAHNDRRTEARIAYASDMLSDAEIAEITGITREDLSKAAPILKHPPLRQQRSPAARNEAPRASHSTPLRAGWQAANRRR